jgi:hypothetical protein
MGTNQIISALDTEIARLKQVRSLLNGTATKYNPATKSVSPKKHTLSAAARARISAAQKARWAKLRKAK